MLFFHIRLSTRLIAVLFALIGLSLCPTVLHAVVILGQADNFETGTALNWTNGAPAADPAVVAGGPGGATDHFLKVIADGIGAAGRIISFNRTQWLGDYGSAGITAIEMDLQNLGASTLSMRIGFKQAIANGAPGYVTTTPFSLPADSSWHHAVFSLSDSDMTAIGSPAISLSALLANPAEIRILHSVNPAINADIIVSAVGIDNITAVPEPGTLAMLLLAAGTGIAVYASKKQF